MTGVNAIPHEAISAQAIIFYLSAADTLARLEAVHDYVIRNKGQYKIEDLKWITEHFCDLTDWHMEMTMRHYAKSIGQDFILQYDEEGKPL